MSATLEDVARWAKVSHMTVSLVLNDKGRISEATRLRVREAVHAVGYVPNRAAQALVTGGRTNSIAVWIRRFSSPFYGAVAADLEKRLAANGYEIIVRGFGADRTVLGDWPVDGIIAIDNARTRPVAPKEMQHKQTAFVSAGAYFDARLDHVAIDLAEGTGEAVRHLVRQGCRRIAHLINEAFDSPGDSRRDAYMAAMQEAGMRPEVIVFPDDVREAVGPVLSSYVRENGCPDGLFCRNDDMALGAYQTLRRLGYRIPDDVCLVGCDGTLDTEFLDVPLSTIVTPVSEMCAHAWDFLRRRMEHPDCPQMAMTLHSLLQVRSSSQRLPD